MGCPNKCSNRGVCLSMRNMAAAKNALPISPSTTYGNDPVRPDFVKLGCETYSFRVFSLQHSSTWDSDRIYGCVCDSRWAVGTASNELQATEFFGADCSKRT